MRLNEDSWASTLFLFPLIIVFAVFFAYPLLDLIFLSFTSQAGSFTIAQWGYLLHDPFLIPILWNTLYYFLGSVLAQYGFGFIVAILLYNYTGKLKGFFNIAFFVPLMVSPVASSLMWALIFDQHYGPLNYFLQLLGGPALNWLGSTQLAMPSLFIVNMWEFSPYAFVLIYAGLQLVPTTLYEAGEIDGMTGFQKFIHITVPQIKGPLLAAFVLDAISILKGFDLVYVLTSGGPGISTSILSFYVYQVAFSFLKQHYAAVLSLLLLIIISAFLVFMFKFTSVEEHLGLKGDDDR
jgi:multiple sugar transport system permease protein